MSGERERKPETDSASSVKAKRKAQRGQPHHTQVRHVAPCCVALAVYQSAPPGRDAEPSKTVPQPHRCDKLFPDGYVKKAAAKHRSKEDETDMDRSTMLKVGIGVLIVAVYGTARVMQDRPPADTAPPPAERSETLENYTHKPTTAPGTGGAASGTVTQLVKQDLKVGKGAAAKPGDRVTVHYRGTLTNGTKFDASYDRHEPFVFTLGGGEVIKGWDVGVAGMKVGGKRKLTVPSDMAYGPAGRPPTIPPDATLVFEVELLKVN